MKKFVLSLILVLFFGYTFANEVESNIIIDTNTRDVIEYNNNLADILDLCLKNKNIFKGLNTNSYKKLNCSLALEQINNISDWEGDSSLKDSVKEVIKISQEIYDQIFSTVILEGDSNSRDYKSAIKNLKKTKTSLDGSITKMLDIQRKFADKFGYTLD